MRLPTGTAGDSSFPMGFGRIERMASWVVRISECSRSVTFVSGLGSMYD